MLIRIHQRAQHSRRGWDSGSSFSTWRQSPFSLSLPLSRAAYVHSDLHRWICILSSLVRLDETLWIKGGCTRHDCRDCRVRFGVVEVKVLCRFSSHACRVSTFKRGIAIRSRRQTIKHHSRPLDEASKTSRIGPPKPHGTSSSLRSYPVRLHLNLGLRLAIHDTSNRASYKPTRTPSVRATCAVVVVYDCRLLRPSQAAAAAAAAFSLLFHCRLQLKHLGPVSAFPLGLRQWRYARRMHKLNLESVF